MQKIVYNGLNSYNDIGLTTNKGIVKPFSIQGKQVLFSNFRSFTAIDKIEEDIETLEFTFSFIANKIDYDLKERKIKKWLDNEVDMKLYTDDDKYYEVMHIEVSGIKKISNLEYEFTVKFFCRKYRYSSFETIIANRVAAKNINILGDKNVAAIVEIIASSDLSELILEGFAEYPIVIKNLKTGKKVIIDGEKQTITQDGINNFNNCDLWEYPTFKPGENTIKISRNICDITIKYRPRWL